MYTALSAVAAAIAASEIRVLWRNRTAATTAIAVPLLIGGIWAFTIRSDDPASWGMIMALQLAVVLGFGVYVTVTATVTGRRHTEVLKRLRATGADDRAVLGGLAAPGVGFALAQLVALALIDGVSGAPAPAEPVVLVLAVLLGLALCVAAGLATTVVTHTAERAQLTTMPLAFVMMGGAVVLPLLDFGPLSQALVAIPGAGIGALCNLALRGTAWTAGPAGLPAALPALVSLAVWTVLFGLLARRYFQWQPRR